MYSCLNNLTKDHTPAAASIFMKEEIDNYMATLSVENPFQLQGMPFILVAFMGGINPTENYELHWEDIEFPESKRENFVRVHKMKRNLSGWSFASTDYTFFDVLP